VATKVGEAYVEIGARTSKFYSAMGRVQKRFLAIGATLARIGKRAGIALGVALAAGAALSVKAFVSFEAEMRNVNSIAKQSEAQLEATSNQVLDLAKEMGKPPTELASALYDLNSSGFAGAEAMEVLTKATVAGRAGISDTATAAKAITGVLNAYGMSAKEAGDVSDILFKTVDRGVVTFPELSSGLGQVVSTAAAAKIPFAQVGAAIATMTKGGIESAEATTALNRIMMTFIQSGPKMKAALESEGISSGAALLETEGLAGAMAFLQRQTGGEAEKLIGLGLEMRAFKAGASLTRNAGAAFAEDLKLIADKTERAGATQAAFAEQSKALKVQLEKLQASVIVLGIKIGKVLAPYIAKAVTLMKKWADSWAEIDFNYYIMMLKLFWSDFSSVFKKIGAVTKAVAVQFVDLWKWQINTGIDLFTNLVRTIQTLFTNLKDNVWEIFKAIWHSITHPNEKFVMPEMKGLLSGLKLEKISLPPMTAMVGMWDRLREIDEKRKVTAEDIQKEYQKAATAAAAIPAAVAGDGVKKKTTADAGTAGAGTATAKKAASFSVISMADQWKKLQEGATKDAGKKGAEKAAKETARNTKTMADTIGAFIGKTQPATSGIFFQGY